MGKMFVFFDFPPVGREPLPSLSVSGMLDTSVFPISDWETREYNLNFESSSCVSKKIEGKPRAYAFDWRYMKPSYSVPKRRHIKPALETYGTFKAPRGSVRPC